MPKLQGPLGKEVVMGNGLQRGSRRAHHRKNEKMVVVRPHSTTSSTGQNSKKHVTGTQIYYVPYNFKHSAGPNDERCVWNLEG
jgi:hypothetical protein